MYMEERIDKSGKVRYRFKEEYYDPRFDKWRVKSVTMDNKTRETKRELKRYLQTPFKKNLGM